MTNTTKITLLTFLLFLTFCKKPEKYSEIPEINFINIKFKDTIDLLGNPIKYGNLMFYLIDGDGDFGLADEDTFPPFNLNSQYYNNLFIDLFKKTDTQIVLLPLNFRYRIKNFVDYNYNRILKCTIKVSLPFYYPLLTDCCEFKFYVFDRNLNKSNIASTGLVKISN